MHVLGDDAMRLRRGERDVAGHLLLGDLLRAKAEWRRLGVARLNVEARPVDGTSIEPWRRARLEAASTQAEQLERFAQQLGWRLTGSSRGIGLLATVDQSIQECSGGDDDRLSANRAPVAQLDAL